MRTFKQLSSLSLEYHLVLAGTDPLDTLAQRHPHQGLPLPAQDQLLAVLLTDEHSDRRRLALPDKCSLHGVPSEILLARPLERRRGNALSRLRLLARASQHQVPPVHLDASRRLQRHEPRLGCRVRDVHRCGLEQQRQADGRHRRRDLHEPEGREEQVRAVHDGDGAVVHRWREIGREGLPGQSEGFDTDRGGQVEGEGVFRVPEEGLEGRGGGGGEAGLEGLLEVPVVVVAMPDLHCRREKRHQQDDT